MFYIGYDKEVGGIGDFVYIIFQYYYFYISNGIANANEFKICIPDHPLKHCIECIQDEPEQCKKIRVIACSNVSEIFINDIYSEFLILLRCCCASPQNFDFATSFGLRKISNIHHVLIYSNMNDFLHLCVRYASKSKLSVLRREFREKVFCISPRVLKYADYLISCSPVSYNEKYSAIHIRCGDKYLRKCGGADGAPDDRCSPESDELKKKVECGVNFLRRVDPIPIFIFCDNAEIKSDLAKQFNCYTFNTTIIHISDTDKTEIEGFITPSLADPQNFEISNNSTIDTFAEFVLLSRSTEIFAVSISNFSQVPAFIYDIPIYTIDTNDTNDTNNIIKCTVI